jgi:hypothetical protein
MCCGEQVSKTVFKDSGQEASHSDWFCGFPVPYKAVLHVTEAQTTFFYIPVNLSFIIALMSHFIVIIQQILLI